MLNTTKYYYYLSNPNLKTAFWSIKRTKDIQIWDGRNGRRLVHVFHIGLKLFVYLSIYLSIHLSIYLSFFLYIYISIYLAVKFGRMSKKQREKVEEEVSFHQANSRVNIYCYYLTWKTTFMRHLSNFLLNIWFYHKFMKHPGVSCANSRVNIYWYYLTWKTTFMRHLSGFPSKNKTSETTVRHLYCLL